MGLSMGQGLFLKQRMQQMMKLELSLALKQVLAQLLILLEKMLDGTWSVQDVRVTEQALIEINREERGDLAYEFARRNQPKMIGTAIRVLKFISSQKDSDPKSALADFSRQLTAIQHDRFRKERDWQQAQQGLTLGLRLILKGPNWFGGKDGTPENLAELLRGAPQRDDAGDIVWVLAGGWAVELLTGKHLRHHHDIDAVLATDDPLFLDCDEVHTDDYFGVLATTRRFLFTQCVSYVLWQHEMDRSDVAVLRPEFLFLSKILKIPRPQDWEDVQVLVEQFAATWDLDLMRKLIKRNRCGFQKTRELMGLLSSREVQKILLGLTQNFR